MGNIQPTLKPELAFRRPTGVELAFRPERTFTTKATCFEYPFLQRIPTKAASGAHFLQPVPPCARVPSATATAAPGPKKPH